MLNPFKKDDPACGDGLYFRFELKIPGLSAIIRYIRLLFIYLALITGEFLKIKEAHNLERKLNADIKAGKHKGIKGRFAAMKIRFNINKLRLTAAVSKYARKTGNWKRLA